MRYGSGLRQLYGPPARVFFANARTAMASIASTSSPPVTIEFETLAEHRPYLMKVARLELRDEHLAEDCVSDVLTQAYEHRDKFRGESSLRTWLTSILRNRCVDLLRKQWREQPLEEAPDGEHEFDRLFDETGHYAEMPGAVRDPADLCQQDGFLAAVQRCVEKLPKRIGQVFVLREVFGSDTKELCKDLGLTSSNVWVQLYRARMMLRTCLEKTGFGNAPAG
jgi:RNA polymerase sigma-70 factor (ECF subfamily)